MKHGPKIILPGSARRMCGAIAGIGLLFSLSTALAQGITTNISPAVDFLTQHVSLYEPTYFIVGSFPAAEFQFSVKLQVFNFETNSTFRPMNDFFLAYTQTSFWDLFSSDPSFFDSSYKPSAFILATNVLERWKVETPRLDLQTGFEHESNGRGGTQERSMYTLYLQPNVTFELPADFEFSVTPRAWYYAIKGSNNPDIANFYGYGDLIGTLWWRHNFKLETMYRLGDHWDHSTVRVDFSFGFQEWLKFFTPRIHAQYFTGYGQTFIQYNQHSNGYRIGISLFD